MQKCPEGCQKVVILPKYNNHTILVHTFPPLVIVFAGSPYSYMLSSFNYIFDKYINFFMEILELSATGTIVEWGECLPDCPQEEVSSVCIMEPEFPKQSDGSHGTANFTSNYDFKTGYETRDVS